jgi:glutamate racemase
MITTELHELQHLGLLDWGIGGLDLYTRIARHCPALDVTYLSDAGFTPYGKVDTPMLCARVEQALSWFADRGVDLVVVACNAASTVLPLLTHAKLPVLGVIEPTLALLAKCRPDSVVVLGGQRTIESGAYTQALSRIGIPTHGVVAQPLSAFIEAGELSGPSFEAMLENICRAVTSVDTLVPACTHYIAALPKLIQLLNPQQLIDPASVTFSHLLRHYTPSLERHGSKTERRVFTTGSPRLMADAAARAFGIALTHVHPLDHQFALPG